MAGGFRIAWVFDNDPDKIGEAINGIPVQPVDEMGDTVRQEDAQVAILAVPAAAAQEITDILVEAGVRAILTYAPISLAVPEDVHVQYSDPVVQLQRMTFYLTP